jgi:septum formation protein
MAMLRAASVAKSHPGRLILGADQTLALGSKRFSKSPDRLAARAQLQALLGRTHELHAAIAFVQDGAVVFEHVELIVRLQVCGFALPLPVAHAL